MWEMPVYRAERKDGLAHRIRSEASIVYASPIQIVEASKANVDIAKLAKAMASLRPGYEQVFATNEGQFDLFYMKSIMATVGWNLNDDVFDIKETWSARKTPEDKPFNLEHNPRKIIGHITGNYTMDCEGKVLDDELSIEDLPEKFHLVSAAVVYRFLKSKDEDLEKETKELIEAIEAGDYFVSMEALFAGFDYAVITADGSHAVIPRNEDSAFLTKYLRAYGGKGEYEGNKVGRLMRNLVFSGKGLVKSPANPESVTFAKVLPFHAAKAEIQKLTKAVGYITVSDTDSQKNQKESKVMAEAIEVVQLQERNKSLEASLTAANQKVDKLSEQLNSLSNQQVEARIKGFEADLKSKDERLAALEAQVKTEQTARTEAEKKAKETEAALATAREELTKVKAQEVKRDRVAKWLDRTGASLEVATKAVERAWVMALSEEAFAELLADQPAKAAATQTPPVEEKKKVDSGAANASEKVLETAKANEQAALNQNGGSNGVEETRAKIHKYLKAALARNRNGRNVPSEETTNADKE
jgi:ABC-type phosphate transport system auxiliary subunit